MPEEKFTILSTRPIEQRLITKALDNNIEIESISFIRTEPIINSLLKKRVAEIVSKPSVIIFTSMNAAEAVAGYLEGSEPQWDIYCLGTATKKVIEKNFRQSSIVGEASNASLLADEIVKNSEKELIFFCGDQRRDELPEKLMSRGIILEEMVIYKTIAIPVKIEKSYDGILFFSPSAVESFFSLNDALQGTVLFAIGSTTSECISSYSSNLIIESDQPGKNCLVEKSINYFGKLNHTDEHIKK